MLLDLHETTTTDFEADLCVVGAGPAGIAIARALLGTRLQVCVLESGGLAPDPSTQSLCDGESVGAPWDDPTTSRLRCFGGTTRLWGGGCMPLDPLDFEQRPWVPHSGWPFPGTELERYYERARAHCGIGGFQFGDGERASPDPLRFDGTRLVDQFILRSPITFGESYRDELERARNVKVLLHANLVELSANESASRIQCARLRTLEGRSANVRARCFVLACGGIENARILLLSSSVAPRGLGNDHDMVGRYFMDHPTGRLGTILTETPERLLSHYDRTVRKGVAPRFPELCLTRWIQEHHGLLSGRVRPYAVEHAVPRGIQALRELRAGVRERRVPDRLPGLGLRLASGLHHLIPAAGRKLAGRPTVATHHVELRGYFEQAPNPDSRVTLSDRFDALGQRKVRVDWRLTDLDHRSYRAAALLFGAALAEVCRGRLQVEPWLADPGAAPEVGGAAHHIGTTRMSDDPRRGVVDRECRVHGIDNLYVAGSSVFPTGGWAFPTFTIVALGLRLADHLRARLASYHADAIEAPPPALRLVNARSASP